MKLTILSVLLISFSVFGRSEHDRRNNPLAPLLIACKINEAESVTYRVMELFFDSKTGKSYGTGFGPNRGDEGFVELKGECKISPARSIE